MKKQEPKTTSPNLTNNQKWFLSLKWRQYEPGWEDLRRELCHKLTDNELAAFRSVPNLDLGCLFWNIYLYWYGQWDDQSRLEWPKAIASYLTNLAFAINKPNAKAECLGRLTHSWFKPHIGVQEGTPYWTGQYKQTLTEGDDDFTTEYEDLQNHWPPELIEFRNMAIPQWAVILNPKSLAETCIPETRTTGFPRFECNENFLRKARKFVMRWNLEVISCLDGKWDFVPAKVCCVSDRDGQGTYVFIPRYCKWDDFRNHVDADFKHLHDLIDKTYARFESVGNVKGRKDRQLSAYIKQGLGNQKATEIRVFKLVDEWIAKEGYKGHDQRRKYRNVARKAFNLPDPE